MSVKFISGQEEYNDYGCLTIRVKHALNSYGTFLIFCYYILK